MQELSALKLFTISNNGHTAVKLPKQNGVAKYISPCASVARIECCESGAPKGAERSPTGHEAAGRGRVPRGWNSRPFYECLPLSVLRLI